MSKIRDEPEGCLVPSFKWSPIELLSDADATFGLVETSAYVESWHSFKSNLEERGLRALDEFHARLFRSLNVETGIIEKIYDLDFGTTETLVAQGFVQDLIARDDTNLEPAMLIEILRDHEAAIKLVVDCIAQGRRLTVSVLHELHATLTRHQSTTTGIDPQGVRRDIPLLRGRFKEHPNNPTTTDGSVHEYCPPIHTASQIDCLLEAFQKSANANPIVLASWMHHRFTQIHPYQDGNGRLARVLMTYVLLRAKLLPIVVTRGKRKQYMDALRRADTGSLTSLIKFFASIEQGAILQALSVDIDVTDPIAPSTTSVVIEDITRKLLRRREKQSEELRSVNEVARGLRAVASEAIEKEMRKLSGKLSGSAFSLAPQVTVEETGSNEKRTLWYRDDVIATAHAASKWINFDEEQYFVNSSIASKGVKLTFVVSFHHVGRSLTGLVEATAFARIELGDDDNERVLHESFSCFEDPFAVTWKSDVDGLLHAFSPWLDQSLGNALKEWGDNL